MENSKAPTLYISGKDFARLRLWSKLAVPPDSSTNYEIGGYGQFDFKKQLISGLFLVPQNAGISNVEFDMTGLSPHIAGSRHPERYCLWWHSHGVNGVGFSSTDLGHVEDWGRHAPFVISIVVNADNDVYTRVDYFRPARCFVLCKLEIYSSLSDAESEQMSTEVKSKVKFNVYTPPATIPTVNTLNNNTTSGYPRLREKLPDSFTRPSTTVVNRNVDRAVYEQLFLADAKVEDVHRYDALSEEQKRMFLRLVFEEDMDNDDALDICEV